MAQQYRGLEQNKEINPGRAQRDTRLIEHKLRDALDNPRHVAVVLLFGYAVTYLFPVLFWFLLPVCLIVGIISWNTDRNLKLPMRLPLGAPARIDRNNPKPQHKGFWKPMGQFMVGVTSRDSAQVWQSGKDMLTHWLVVGTTGSGKTVTLLSMAANSLAMGSGVIYSDAKATPDLDWDIATLARLFGREDDLLVTNYIGGTAEHKEIGPERLTNTENPFAIGTADTLMQVLSALMSESGDGNKIFQDRAVSAMTAELFALVELRDKGELLLGIDTIREHLSLNKLIELRHNPKLSERTRHILYSYLESALPKYLDGEPGEKQPEEAHTQHGYAQSYFTRAAASLTDTYGRIYLTKMGEVDKVDVVLNRRIAVTMLPATEKASNELENLGKMHFASIRDALRVGLGKHLEGGRAEVLDNLPTASDVPTLIILDELAYQMTEGMAITAAQARGFGICMVYSMQDFAGPQKANEKEFQQIVGSTTNKLIMKLEDAHITWEQVKAIAGEGMAAEVQHLERTSNAMSRGSFHDNPTAAYQRRARVDLMDLREQVEGEGHLFFGGHILRIKTFTAVVDRIADYRINRFLTVDEPLDGDLPEAQLRIASMVAFFASDSNSESAESPPMSARLAAALEAMRATDDGGHLRGPISAVATYASFDENAASGTAEDDASTGGQLASKPTNEDESDEQTASMMPSASAATDDADEVSSPASPVFDALPDEPPIVDAEDGDDTLAATSFLTLALDTEATDFLFAFDAQMDLDYDIAASMARVEHVINEEATVREALTTGEQIKREVNQALTYPTPPEPRITEDMSDEISESLKVLLPEQGSGQSNPAAGERTVETEVAEAAAETFDTSDPQQDL